MKRSLLGLVILVCACGDDPRPVNIPVVAPGDHEAECQRLCTIPAGDEQCEPKHAEFCLAACRTRTNDLPAACAECLLTNGSVIHGFIGSFGDPYCSTGGPTDISNCDVCDDGGAAPAAPELVTLCTLECAFYMQDPTPLACSDEGSEQCIADCNAVITSRGRVCAQCLSDQTIEVRSCLNDVCDCEPQFVDDPNFGCDEFCDDQLPPA